jgi:hypothetical protein
MKSVFKTGIFRRQGRGKKLGLGNDEVLMSSAPADEILVSYPADRTCLTKEQYQREVPDIVVRVCTNAKPSGDVHYLADNAEHFYSSYSALRSRTVLKSLSAACFRSQTTDIYAT